MACSWLGSRTPRKVSMASGESQTTTYLPGEAMASSVVLGAGRPATSLNIPTPVQTTATEPQTNLTQNKI
jgi:hypothetical protein